MFWKRKQVKASETLARGLWSIHSNLPLTSALLRPSQASTDIVHLHGEWTDRTSSELTPSSISNKLASAIPLENPSHLASHELPRLFDEGNVLDDVAYAPQSSWEGQEIVDSQSTAPLVSTPATLVRSVILHPPEEVWFPETTHEQIEVYIRDFSMPDPLSERPEDLVTSSILRCLTDIRDITRSYRKKHPHHARRFALSRESREKVDPTKDADDIIWSIEQHVQIVHIKRELKEFVNQYEEALEHLREMDETLQTFSRQLRLFAKVPSSIAKAWEDMSVQARKWKFTMSLQGLVPLRMQTSAFVPFDSEEFRPPNVLEDCIKPVSSIETLCPLQVVMADQRSEHKALHCLSLQDFVSWVQSASRDIVQRVGSVQSIHLFRGRSAIHHEFALLRFEGFDGSSWLRVERAAQVNWGRLEIRSVGPLLGGAPLRETVTASSSKVSLTGTDADEIAAVNMTDISGAEASQARVFMDIIAAQLKGVADASPRYKLLNANCRWFARHLLLSFAQQLHTLAPGYSTVAWGGQVCSIDDLALNIQAERFGGKQLLEGPKAALMNAQSLAQLADSYCRANSYDKALESCQTSLMIIAETETESFNRQLLAASTLNLIFAVLYRTQFHFQSSGAIQRACDAAQRFCNPDPSDFMPIYIPGVQLAFSPSEHARKGEEGVREAVERHRLMSLPQDDPEYLEARLAITLSDLAQWLESARRPLQR